MPGLREYQQRFLRDLWSGAEDTSESALAVQSGFSVYRNTVMAGCIDALAANYPTVRQLIGVDCFADAAAAFARKFPPSSGVLAGYGEDFAIFLSAFDAVVELEYLPGVATLDRCWTEAHFAADATVLRPADLAGVMPGALSRARLVPHPAARWQTFDAMPIYTIWRRHREGVPLDDELDWRGESALVTRPTGTVVWTAIPRTAAIFLSSCASGHPFARAMDDAFASDDADDASWLPMLIRAGAFARFEDTSLDPMEEPPGVSAADRDRGTGRSGLPDSCGGPRVSTHSTEGADEPRFVFRSACGRVRRGLKAERPGCCQGAHGAGARARQCRTGRPS